MIIKEGRKGAKELTIKLQRKNHKLNRVKL